MERELIRWLRDHLPPHRSLRLGLGDDAAVLNMAGVDECVITVDMLTDHVDFELAEVDPRRVGRKCLAANLSDLAAMAARPMAGVVALCLPRQGGLELAKGLFEGMIPLAEQYELAIAGGDTNSWDGPLAVSITLLGGVTERGPLRRGGAQPGDRIVVTGSLGGSILGRHLDFEPRVREAIALHARYELHAGMDISDGLSLDLARMLEESRCGAVIRADAVPVSDDARRLSQHPADGVTPLNHALSDGEDFELLLAVPPVAAQQMLAEQSVDVPLTDIGEFVSDAGLWIAEADGVRRPLEPRGWEHRLDNR
ncbi:MAG: thiamine-phosphate kinase [Planctomycetaceae bacterium]|nr:thiamine-phosphate kinase [Planctomycetaceae bacterium]